MEKFINFKEFILKYILYLFPLFIVLGNAAVNLIFLIIFILYLLSCITEKKFFFLETYEFKYFSLFYVYLLINSFLADDIIVALTRSLPYVKFFVFVLIFKNLIDERKINLKILGYLWFLIIFFLSLDIIYQSIFGYDIFGYVAEYSTRNSGFFFDELVAGGFLVAFVFLSIFLIKRQINNIFFYLLIIFFLIVIFLTGERANFLDFLILTICIYLFCVNKNLLYKFFSLFLSFLVIIFVFSTFDSFKGRYLSTISYSQDENLNLLDTYFTSEYGAHSISSFLILKDNLLFGVGNKNFRSVCNEYKIEAIDFQKKIILDNRDILTSLSIEDEKGLYPHGCSTHPHQIYNELLSEHGLIGSIIILFIISKLLLKNFSFKKKDIINKVCFFYIILYFVPILPSGSFFSTLPSTFFWINYLFYTVKIRNND